MKLIDMVKALAQLHSLFGRNSAVHSGLNLRKRSFAASVHELCNIEMFTGMFEDVFGNGTSRFAEDIGEHVIQPEIGDGETVLGTVLLASQHIRQLHAVADKIAQMANSWRRDKGRLDHVAHEQVANPLCVFPVSFVALLRPCVLGVCEGYKAVFSRTLKTGIQYLPADSMQTSLQ